MEQASWVKNLLLPCIYVSDSSPNYDDDFIKLKKEMNKQIDTNFEWVKNASINFIKNKYKDIRVIGYLVIAIAYLDDIKIFSESLELYQSFLSLEKVFPDKEVSQIKAIELLNNPRLFNFIRSKLNEVDLNHAKLLHKNIIDLYSLVINKYLDNAPNLTTLKKIQQAVEQKISLLENKNQKSELISKPDKDQDKIENFKVKDMDDAKNTIQHVIEFFFGHQHRAQAIAYSRALRWSTLNPYLLVDNKTAVISPPIDEINFLYIPDTKKRAEEIFIKCENIFLTSTWQCVFDLQHYIYKLLGIMEDQLAQDRLTIDMLALCIKNIGLVNYTFKDDTPFANEVTKQWIRELYLQKQLVSDLNNKDNQQISCETLSQRLLNEVQNLSFEKSIAHIEKHMPTGTKDIFHQLYAKALVCKKYKKYDVSHYIFSRMNIYIEKHQLSDWDEGLIFDVRKDYLSVLNILLKINKFSVCSERDEIERSVCGLKMKLCEGQMSKALNILNG